ncbi:MAG: DNA adenine methylase [Gammaproteobacteria bacterium]|nr:DNA adenine methylase [Gammaproteobacteria bacterium]
MINHTSAEEIVQVSQVDQLPSMPAPGAIYSFAGIERNAVTYFGHNLHKYPAKFIPQIPQWALNYEIAHTPRTVLDPFCGSGTTLVEAGLRGHNAVGFDINPLAVLITKAKTADISDYTTDFRHILEKITHDAIEIARSLLPILAQNCGKECLDMHYTWSNWFRPEEMSKLVALRESINTYTASEASTLRDFLFACLSSVTKASSYLSEDQIKVRFDAKKQLADPLKRFERFAEEAFGKQLELVKILRRMKARFRVEVASAEAIPVGENTIDQVITSPPYINAVDYTMTHKYNLFLLQLIHPESFKKHCRQYIGMTERAVKSSDLVNMTATGIEAVDIEVFKIWNLGTPTARNRSFVVAQYFRGMHDALRQMLRVVRPGGTTTIIVGETNRICGQEIKTADLIQHLAEAVGWSCELRFYHYIANRSSMRLNRSQTGGQIKLESILVLRK